MTKLPSAAGSTVTLRQATYGFVVAGIIIFSIGVALFASAQRTEYQNAAQEVAVRVRVQGAAADLARKLAEDWGRLTLISEEAATPDAVNIGLRGAFASDQKVAWVGLVEGDGLAQSALDGQTRDMSQRSWLAAARSGPFISVVDNDADLESYLVMARPLHLDAKARTLVVMMSFDRLSGYLKVSGAALGMDLFLVGPSSESLATTSDIKIKTLNLQSLRNASAGIATSQREMWPDGELYYSSVVSLDQTEGLPPTGLRLIGRMDHTEFAAADRALMKESLRLVLGLLIAIGLLTLLFVRTFIAPFAALAENADRIADGADEYPYEGRQTKEIAQLSAAFARIRAGRRTNGPH